MEFKKLWHFVFPSYCIVCEKFGDYLCEDCLNKIPIRIRDFCPICEKNETFLGKICGICKQKNKSFFLDGLIVSSYFKHPVLIQSVYLLKYALLKDLSLPLAKILAKKINNQIYSNFSFTSVPLHQEKELFRGFNQSILLGRKLQSELLKQKITINFIPDLLTRKKNNKAQMTIKMIQKRKENIKGCFKLNKSYTTKLPEKIIIIDDISTTSATLNECAKVLKRNGVKIVWGIVLARQAIRF